jgi:hypothetical protein
MLPTQVSFWLSKRMPGAPRSSSVGRPRAMVAMTVPSLGAML